MISHYFTLKALCDELMADCRGSILRESYTRVKDEMAMTLETVAGETRTLVICVGASHDAVFLRDGRSRAKRNSADIFPGIFGSTITGITVDEYSRVVTITAGEFRVRIHLFGSALSNVFLVDTANTVVSALTNGRELAGGRYETGKTEREVVAPDDADRFARIYSETAGQTAKAVKAAFPWLGGLYSRELLFRCGSELSGASARPGRSGGEDVAGLTAGGDVVPPVLARLKDMLEEASRPSPRRYAVDGFGGTVLSVIPLTHAPPPAEVTFRSVNDAVRETFFTRRNRSGFAGERERLLAAAAKEKEKISRSLGQAKSRADDASAPEIHRRTGTLILTHINDIRKGQTEVEVPDGDGGPGVRIRLDRSLTPAGNANVYFDRARKAEKALEESARRVGELTAKLATIDAWIDALGACDDPGELRAIVEARGKKTPSSRVAVDTAGGERLPFRVFPIGEQFEVWVGKSSADNDLLTMKHAGPHDFWFHVRGASGSHVVLKNRSGGKVEPPREVIRAAARIAAYYSKMRKGGNVPVAYCQRKYVKKPKNAPPGTVTLLREEIVFVTPGIP